MMGGWVGSRVVLDSVENRKTSLAPTPQASNQQVIHTDWNVLAPFLSFSGIGNELLQF
jgi:hypothetical protein